MNELKPGTYDWILWERDHKRGTVRVELLGRVPCESHYYRVRQPDGRIGIASDSMLREVSP